MDENLEKFAAELEKSLAAATFVKLILSNYKGADRQLQKISVRPLETKKGACLMFQSRYETRDIVKNFAPEETSAEVRRLLGSGFRSGHLFTTENDLQLDIGKRNSRLRTGKATFTAKQPTAHDREKKTLIDPNAFYLKALGISTDDGRIKSGQQDKWRQINKFVEILAGLVDASPLKDKPDLKIIDMGSGKGYLTFAAYDYLQKPARSKGIPLQFTSQNSEAGPDSAFRNPHSAIQMTGIDQREELVSLCSEIAKAGGYENLKFVQGTIIDFDPGPVDILIALHACDTATDDALFKGVAANASIIIAAPCCHKELRKQITPPEMLAGILKHGIMLERTAETITDGLRSLLLEREGYATKLFEFVPTEHTPKNNMLVATKKSRRPDNSRIRHQISEVKTQFGISKQQLEELLNSRESSIPEKENLNGDA